MFLVQALTDLLVALFLVLSTIWLKHGYSLSRGFEQLFIFIFEYTIFLSLSVLLIASLERLISIRFPFHRHKYVTKSKIVLAMLVTCVASALPSVVFVTYVFPSKVVGRSRVYYVVVIVVSLVLVVVVYAALMVTYITIKKNIRQRIQRRRWAVAIGPNIVNVSNMKG